MSSDPDRRLEAAIAAHPHLAVGIAFGLGALLGLSGKRATSNVEPAEVKRGLIGAAMATFGTLAFHLAKDVALHHLSSELGSQAKAWWDRHANAWRTPDLESFLEH